MKKLLFLSLFLFSLLSCNVNKEKNAWSIYNSTKPTMVSMSPAEEHKRMEGVTGCYGLTLGKTTKSEAIKSMLPLQPTSEEFHYKTNVLDDYISDEYIETSNINVLSWQMGYSDNEVNITTIFVNDTLTQAIVKYGDANKSSLKENLIAKYGEGNGEFKNATFGIDKKGEIDFSDYCPGYDRREWQNEDISICYEEEGYINKLSNNKYLLRTEAGSAVYTSKIMAPRLLFYLEKAYNLIKNQKKTKEKTNLDNL